MLRTPLFAISTLLSLVVLTCIGDDSRGQAPPAKDVHGDPLPAGALARLGTVRWRHGGITGFVAFSPDGKSVVSASDDRVFHVWEFPSGKELRRFGPGANEASISRYPSPQEYGGLPLAVSPDGKVLACNFDLTDILLYDVATGKEIGTLKQRGDRSALAFSPDGRHLAVYDVAGGLSIWDWAAAKEVHRRKLAKSYIEGALTLAWSPDGKLLAAVHNEEDASNVVHRSIKLLDAGTAQDVRAISVGKDAHVTAVVFAPDSKMLAFTTHVDSTVYLADVATGKQLRQIQSGDAADVILAFSRDGKSLFTHSWSGLSVCEWAVATGQQLRDSGEVTQPLLFTRSLIVTLPALSPDGSTLALAGTDHTLHFVDLPKGKEIPDAGSTISVAAVGFWSDGKRLWTQDYSKILRQWDGNTGKELSPIILPSSFGKKVISPDGRYAALESRGKQAGRIVSVATQKQIGAIKPGELKQRSLTNMAFSPDGALLAVRWDQEQKIELYEVPSAKLLCSLDIVSGLKPVSRFPTSPVLLFSADGKMLAAYSEPGVLSLWDTASGQKLTKWSLADRLPVLGGAFTADSRCLALDVGDGTVVLWELACAKERRIFGTQAAPGKGSKLPRSLAESVGVPLANVMFAPSGKLLVHGGLDRAIRVWNVQTGQERAAFRGHNGSINALAFSADGKKLASASGDTTALIWDLSNVEVPPLAKGVLSADQLEARWTALKSDSAAEAFAALCELTAAPNGVVTFLKNRIQPAPAPDAKMVKKLIVDLDDPAFKVRQYATAALLKLGEAVVPALDKALSAAQPLETVQRLKDLRIRLTGFALTDEKLRLYRAVEVLEQIGTPEARQMLQALADGAPGALATTTAQAALTRLTKQ